MVILICGSRTATAIPTVVEGLKLVIEQFKPSMVIHGAAKGADSIGGNVARALDVPVREFPAQWDTHGKAAGHIRNQQMLDEGKPQMVVAVYPVEGITRGTQDMVTRAQKAKIPVLHLTY
jgi:hypothetical protein